VDKYFVFLQSFAPSVRKIMKLLETHPSKVFCLRFFHIIFVQLCVSRSQLVVTNLLCLAYLIIFDC